MRSLAVKIKNKFFKPMYKLYFGLVLFVFSVIGWPYTALTNTTEPPIVMALSWGAILVTAIDIIFTATNSLEQEEQNDK